MRFLFRSFLALMALFWCGATLSCLLLRNIAAPVYTATLPADLVCSGLVMKSMFQYGGVNSGDATDKSKDEIAAAIFYNNSSKIIYSSVITVETNIHTYRFEFTMLPPNHSILVFDINENSYVVSEILSIDADYTTADVNSTICSFGILEDNSLVLSNQSESSIDEIHIHLKKWDNERKMFIGSESNKIEIHDLKAGDKLIISPGFAFPANSKVACIIERPDLNDQIGS